MQRVAEVLLSPVHGVRSVHACSPRVKGKMLTEHRDGREARMAHAQCTAVTTVYDAMGGVSNGDGVLSTYAESYATLSLPI